MQGLKALDLPDSPHHLQRGPRVECASVSLWVWGTLAPVYVESFVDPFKKKTKKKKCHTSNNSREIWQGNLCENIKIQLSIMLPKNTFSYVKRIKELFCHCIFALMNPVWTLVHTHKHTHVHNRNQLKCRLPEDSWLESVMLDLTLFQCF